MLAVSLLQQTRPLLLRLIKDLSEEALLTIPTGFSNNILWNLGHLAVTQQLLHYGLSSLPLNVPDELVAQCRKGTSPTDWDTPPDLDEIKHLLIECPRQLETDLEEARFTTFRPYMTSVGVELTDLETALAFNQYHEGLHTGAILALRRAVQAKS